ncbi:MAG: DUF3987 domain-containing protein [Bacteroidaceae bacterium]|nr:DUF3987 domain-containing protein [Bacteroidaceae bacterium]
MKREEVINGIRSEAQKVGMDSIPIEIFPQPFQSIVLTHNRTENYVIDFSVSALLSAFATAMGNSFRLRIKGLWGTNPALFFIFFGKPGLGKTPPIEAAYLPIRKLDEERMRRYIDEKRVYDALSKEDKGCASKPVLVQTVVQDFTVEALLQAHFANLDGVAVVYDEIIGLVNSADRYNKSPVNEVLLTAFSGGQLSVIRRSMDMPIFIKQPCINIIGTTQTSLLCQISEKWMNNGFLDRVLFIHPPNSTIAPWIDEDETMLEQSVKAQRDWEAIISKVYELKRDKPQTTLNFTPDAKTRFFAWQNSIISSVNAVADETRVDTREMKRCLITAKLALIIQILRHVCGEAGRDTVDLVSVESAITANEYFEESYAYFKQATGMQNVNSTKKTQFIDSLCGEFTSAYALKTGRQLDINERTVKRWLKDLTDKGVFEKLEHGLYRRNEQP